MGSPTTKQARDTTAPRPLRVAIVGGGLSGLCLANGLLNDPENSFEVNVYERDDLTFSSERGGYQIRLGQDGIDGLRECLDSNTYNELAVAWGSELSRAPALVQASNLAIIQKLNDLKHYPKSRAVPRSILKDYLLRIPMARNAVRLSKTLLDVQTFEDPAGTASKVILKFADGTSAECDVLIASDGVRSVVNRCMKINNVSHIGERKHVQGRGPISRGDIQKLPAVLQSNGSILFLNGDFVGFAAVYESVKSATIPEDDSAFLFWSIQIAPEQNERVKKSPDMAEETAKLMEEAGFDSKGIPSIVRLGRNNVKMSAVSSSSEPSDWRGDKTALGRIILIGDSIHAMTPGRGQGANQAMKDAGVLKIRLFDLAQQHKRILPTDAEVLTFSQSFDDEMYKRAFPWVKASKEAFDVDTSRLQTWLLIRAACLGLTGWGLVTSLLENLHLRREEAQVAF